MNLNRELDVRKPGESPELPHYREILRRQLSEPTHPPLRGCVCIVSGGPLSPRATRCYVFFITRWEEREMAGWANLRPQAVSIISYQRGVPGSSSSTVHPTLRAGRVQVQELLSNTQVLNFIGDLIKTWEFGKILSK